MAVSPSGVIIVGAGLAGLVAAYELTLAGNHVTIVDQENRHNLGGQVFWSLGGLFLVNSPEQRRMGISDSVELALQDWFGSAAFDRHDSDDRFTESSARAYVAWAASEKRDYLKALGLKLMPFVGWADRGAGHALGHGNSVPRFHLTWGTGPGVVELFERPVLDAERSGLVTFAFRHRVDELVTAEGRVVGVRGRILEPDASPRGVASSRVEVDTFELHGDAVIVTSGGIGHNIDLMRQHWPTDRLGPAPKRMMMGVPAHVDGRMLEISQRAGANLVNRDRLWAYTEGIQNWDPVWEHHGIRILPGPSSMWFDAEVTAREGCPRPR